MSNSQHPFPTPNHCLLYYLVLTLAPLQSHRSPTGNLLVFISAVSSILHAVRIFRVYVEVLRILHMILYCIYSCTYDWRTFARSQRVPCPYHSVLLPEFQHKCAGIAQTRSQIPHIMSPTRSAKLRERFAHNRDKLSYENTLTATDYDETPSLIYPSTLTTHFITKLTHLVPPVEHSALMMAGVDFVCGKKYMLLNYFSP
jgi:hypothetical protein